MPTWTRNGYVIRRYLNDHAPRHVHVFRDGQQIGRFSHEEGRWLNVDARHAGRAKVAIDGIMAELVDWEEANK